MPNSIAHSLNSNWISRLFWILQYRESRSFFRLPLVISAGLAGVVAFLIGLAAAIYFGLSRSYIYSPTVHLTWFAIAWVFGSVHWGLKKLPKVLDDLAACFYSPSSNEHAQFIKKWMIYFSKNSGMIICASILFLFGALAVILSVCDPQNAANSVFPYEWRSKGFSPFLIIVYSLGLTASLAGGGGFWLFLVNLPLLFSILRRKTIPLPAAVITKLRTVSDFYVVSTFAWFVAVGIGVAIVFKALDAISISFLIFSSVIGLSAFVTPQVIFHILLVRSQQVLADASMKEYYQLITLNSSKNIMSGDQLKLSDLARLNSNAQGSSSWVYDASDIVVLIVSNLVPPIALMLKTFFARN
jgi:hypothetical protein